MATNLNIASQQWATRPEDQRFLSLEELHQAVSTRKEQSWTATPRMNELRAVVNEDGLGVQVYDRTTDQDRILQPTNWGFGQLASYAKAPAGYLRSLPDELAAINLQWGFENNPVRENGLILAQSNGENHLRAVTSQSYGRIWDKKVVEAVQKVNVNGNWQIPAASYATTNPRRATTLYASDRDVFIFLVDPGHEIHVGNETLFRGFIVYNSEVGSATFGLMTFLYRYVCDNRIIWGATDVKELKIRHTGGAPERFAYEGQRYLNRYANESTNKIIEGVVKAQETDVPLKQDETIQDWLRDRFKFTKEQAQGSVDAAQAEEGSTRKVWDIVNGITAYARKIQHTDARVELEQKAGQLMGMVTK